MCLQVYRALAVIAAEGVNHLPKWCLGVAGLLMGAAVLVNLLKVRPQPDYWFSTPLVMFRRKRPIKCILHTC